LRDPGGGTVSAVTAITLAAAPAGHRRRHRGSRADWGGGVAHRTSTAELGALAQPRGELFGLQANGRGRYVMFGGGLPVTHGDGTVIGAVDVSGATVAEDVACAEAARAALTGAA
jgi:uncharacterized protein GlcG (DUF336 family)